MLRFIVYSLCAVVVGAYLLALWYHFVITVVATCVFAFLIFLLLGMTKDSDDDETVYEDPVNPYPHQRELTNVTELDDEIYNKKTEIFKSKKAASIIIFLFITLSAYTQQKTQGLFMGGALGIAAGKMTDENKHQYKVGGFLFQMNGGYETYHWVYEASGTVNSGVLFGATIGRNIHVGEDTKIQPSIGVSYDSKFHPNFQLRLQQKMMFIQYNRIGSLNMGMIGVRSFL